MKAIVLRGANQFALEEMERPACPEGGLLLKVSCVGLCGSDLRKLRFGPHATPVVLGHELVGTVVENRSDRTDLPVGQRVMPCIAAPCGKCYFCQNGMESTCPDIVVQALGYTARPDMQGGFAEYMPISAPLLKRGMMIKVPDIPRLRAVWRKGNAEDQLELTACLLGLPLAYDSEDLPEQHCCRETEPVDRWIRERPMPPRIRNQAKAELIQEIPMFRYQRSCGDSSSYYVSAERCGERHLYGRCHLWEVQADGTIREIWTAEGDPQIYTSAKRIVAADTHTGEIQYDASGRLSGRCLPGCLELLEDGKVLQQTFLEENKTYLVCFSPEGECLWQKIYEPACCTPLAQNGREILMRENTKESVDLVRLDLATGREVGRRGGLVGMSIYQTAWNGGAWWIVHDGYFPRVDEEERQISKQLIKLDQALEMRSQISLPMYSQSLFFSPDGNNGYVFSFEKQVMVLDTENLTVRNVLQDRSFLMPLAFDKRADGPCFWLLRGNSTVEAWDAALRKPLSRHRLKGSYVGCHRDGEGRLCVAAWDEKKELFRVFRLTWKKG